MEITDNIEDGGAATFWVDNYRDATIKFQFSQFRACDDEEVELFVLHELGHLLFADLADSVVGAIGRGTAFQSSYKPEQERLIDRLAVAFRRLR